MKRYLITGASRGIGRAIALRLAASNRRLLLHGRDIQSLAETFRLVQEQGGHATTLTCDLSDPAQVLSLVKEVGDQPLDLLVNNAGVAGAKPIEDVSLEEWQNILAVNVTAPFLLTQRLLPLMPTGASIVNILSTAAKTAFSGWSSYCMSKFAMEGFSLSVREELRSRGIRVINIYPAATATDIWNSVEGDWPRERMMAPAEVAESLAFALERPDSVMVENITIGNQGGSL